MKELDLQDKYLVAFLCRRKDGLGYQEAKSTMVDKDTILKKDLKYFLSQTSLNKVNYKKLLRQFGDEEELWRVLSAFLVARIKLAKNMALFLNTNKTFTFEGLNFHLFYPSNSVIKEDELFEENIFSVVPELSYIFKFEARKRFSFRPDISFFLNGFFLGYSELKSTYNGQNAREHGRKKVAKDYQTSVENYLKIAKYNDIDKSIRKDFLKIFEKAIHITATDINQTYVIRNIENHFEGIKETVNASSYDFSTWQEKVLKDFKLYPVVNKEAEKRVRFEEVFSALYSKKMIEKEILYYNFLERELIKKKGSSIKVYKHNDGRLISPRPKQKFGADKILAKIDEFLAHEHEPTYFIDKVRTQLRAKKVGAEQIQELITKREKYQNNKYVYSLLMQYAAGFGKSNIIGWTTLQLKDLRKNGEYVFDKIMLVVDRIQLRDQLDSKLHNMNIQKGMFVEADSQDTFLKALQTDKRIIIVNLQKFTSISKMLNEKTFEKLAQLRVAFLIDEIHRSNDKIQHHEMLSVFDELQSSFDKNTSNKVTKKNLIVGFTATPSDHTLARFGEFNKYAEAEKIWIPFDSYTMKEAIEDGYILNPIKGVVPVSAKMLFDLPDNELEGFEGDFGYEQIPDNTALGLDEHGQKYRIRKKEIYENQERIAAISKFVVERLVAVVYRQIGKKAKAMLAVSSIKAAIKYKGFIDKYFAEITEQKKYSDFKNAPIYIVYSDTQGQKSASSLNEGLNEKQVLQNFKILKNGLIIVVDKLQTGFDEPKLHTLFLDKEIRGINAIQTISRVNRKIKHKNDCKIIDFSYKNVNVQNIKTAFEHFSNVVISDFAPLNDERKLIELYSELSKHSLYTSLFPLFQKHHKQGVDSTLKIQESFETYILANKEYAKRIKKLVSTYFRLLNLIEFVITLDKKYNEEEFLAFWKVYAKEYHTIYKSDESSKDIEIYFDNKIGIISPKEEAAQERRKISKQDKALTLEEENKYKYHILHVIEKRNQEEEEILELIEDFESKIDLFFAHIKSDKMGKRLVAKIRSKTTAFSQEEIHEDFSKIYRKYSILNKVKLGKFFIKVIKDILPQLCNDFERTLKLE